MIPKEVVDARKLHVSTRVPSMLPASTRDSTAFCATYASAPALRRAGTIVSFRANTAVNQGDTDTTRAIGRTLDRFLFRICCVSDTTSAIHADDAHQSVVRPSNSDAALRSSDYDSWQVDHSIPPAYPFRAPPRWPAADTTKVRGFVKTSGELYQPSNGN